ncbi:thioesterase II family protein [Zhihengliuella salsuginis]|uniref:Pyochelin biosynthetic protein PchC n=1 Tax=Zhihengliuella salsuginis TaxID=578222 RepID=A0ABQ3GGP6_9MICC|nr:alpha/beta fold hydrolase [Zhihengliuella salsuginis]GHD05038.1 pyochelin biosynthetic protein PchC [Zhihengliuella salsuginis]
MHLFCLHHAGGTTASFAKWRFTNVAVTKLGYRGRDFASIPHAAAVLSESVKASPSPRLALYGHSMGAALAYEIALRVQGSGRLQHVFLAAARPPVPARGNGTGTRAIAFAAARSTALSERARDVLLEDLALLESYPGSEPAGQLAVPTTLFHGTDDDIVPALESAQWAGWCAEPPRSVDIPGGHLFHRTSPKVMEVVQTTLTPSTQSVPASTGSLPAGGSRR